MAAPHIDIQFSPHLESIPNTHFQQLLRKMKVIEGFLECGRLGQLEHAERL